MIATASSEEKRKLALELGADVAVDAAGEGMKDRLIEANDGQQVDVVLEMAGGRSSTRASRRSRRSAASWRTGSRAASRTRLADGQPLSFKQPDIRLNGHSLECRINAEDTEKFTPSPGLITRYSAPGGFGVRVDSAMESDPGRPTL